MLKLYIQKIKALSLTVSEKKNFEVSLLCSNVPACVPRRGAVLSPGHDMNKFYRGSSWDAYYQVSMLDPFHFKTKRI